MADLADQREKSYGDPSMSSNQNFLIKIEIEKLKRVATADLSQLEKIHSLKEQHNALVDQEGDTKTPRTMDPLQKLPPELWPNFLPRRATELLPLTLVSDRWRNALISIPILWSSIDLDCMQEDYLSQAVLSLACSAPAEIDLFVRLPLKIWKKVAPIFVTERGRIASLNIFPPVHIQEPTNAFEILVDFGHLPILRTLSSSAFPPLLVNDSGSGTPSWYKIWGDENFFSRTPLLTHLYGCKITAKRLGIPGFSNLKTLSIRGFQEDTVVALRQLSHLRTLYVYEERNSYDTEKEMPHSMHKTLSTLETLDYDGPRLTRTLQCIGPSLCKLEARPIQINQLPEILLALQLFPKLSHLSLYIKGIAGDDFLSRSLDSIHLFPLKFLSLSFANVYRARESVKTRQKQALEHLFQSLITVMPAVEELDIAGVTPKETMLGYVQSLRKLQALDFSIDFASSRKFPLVLTTNQLESVRWYGKIPQDGAFDLLESATLRKLNVRPHLPRNKRSFLSDGLIPTLFPRFATSRGLMINLTTLTITVEHRLVWDLNVFPNLKTLELMGEPSVMAGDVFEELSLQPDTCPALEEIHLGGVYVEWDLLILMLERRNLSSEPGTSRIKLIHLDRNIGYKLLRPITDLLGGKYPDRDPLEEYSTTAIGRVIWDKYVTGCQKCCRAFRTCAKQLDVVREDPSSFEYETPLYMADLRFELDYPSSLELIPANPPLSQEAAQWLAGKAARRRAFAEGCRNFKENCLRSSRCDDLWELKPLRTFGSYSLDGLCFEGDVDE